MDLTDHLSFRLRQLRWPGFALATGIMLLGSLLLMTGVGAPLSRLSFDLSQRWLPSRPITNLVLITMDETSYRILDQNYGKRWSRNLHAKLIEKLIGDECQLILFDVFLTDTENAPDDDDLVQALKKAQNLTVLAADRVPYNEPGISGEQTLLPLPKFLAAAPYWGLNKILQDKDGVVRRHYPGTETDPTLSGTGVRLLTTSDPQSNDWQKLRWIRYYGGSQAIPELSYHLALKKPPGHFKDLIVLIGGKPATRFNLENVDEFRTPLTAIDGQYVGGLTIQATMFLNLWRNEWLNQMHPLMEWILVLIVGLTLGLAINLFAPKRIAWYGLVCMGLLILAAIFLIRTYNIWFTWLIPTAIQIPLVIAFSFVFALPARQNAPNEKSLPTRTVVITNPNGCQNPRSIPDHILTRKVGEGGYGEVWLAQNTIGLYHAVKIVHRHRFKSQGPYDREFRGIKQFMPISRSHPALVAILHVGRNDEAGLFYYIMEASDDILTEKEIDSNRYQPKSLAALIDSQGPIAPKELLTLMIQLANGLKFLHAKGLVHRDIKPANIIYVNGAPKLADIGLVTEIVTTSPEATMVGTKGYFLPEIAGTVGGDLYALGKVLYVALTGNHASQFPDTPTSITQHTDYLLFSELNEVAWRACRFSDSGPYQSAQAMIKDFERIQKDSERSSRLNQ